MKIYQILQGVDNPSSGPSYSVGALSHYLSKLDNDVEVLALGKYPEEWAFNVRLSIIEGFMSQHGLPSGHAIRYIKKIGDSPGILHGHGVWRTANLFPLVLNNTSSAKLLWSPRGMFSDWSWNYRSYRKRPFWYLFQKKALDMVHCFHATAENECEDIRRLGFLQPIAIIPNGVDVPVLPVEHKKQNDVVFLSRIHPKKGLELLIDVWDDLQRQFPDWRLLIAGGIDSSYAKKIVDRTKNIPRMEFLGEILGERKQELLSRARLFVLPTYSENFGLAVAEALAHGTPVITTDQTPWQKLSERGCGWCIPIHKNFLEEAMAEALGLPAHVLDEKGEKGRAWMQQDYAWESIAGDMYGVYNWLQHGGTAPACVMV